jgi:hypothetical protein
MGCGMVLAANLLAFVSMRTNENYVTQMVLIWAAPPIAAFIIAYLAPCRKFLLGLSMAILASILIVVVNSVYAALGGSVDFPGIHGGLVLAEIALVLNGITCAIGALIGYAISRPCK